MHASVGAIVSRSKNKDLRKLPKGAADVKELLDTFGYLFETQDRRLPTGNIAHPVTG